MRTRFILTAAAAAAIGGMAFVPPRAFGADPGAAGTVNAKPDTGANADKSSANSDKNAQAKKKGPVLVGVVTIIPIIVTDPLLPKGAAYSDDLSGAADIRDTLAEVTEAAFTKEGLNDVVERFVDADRNTLGKVDDLAHEKIDGRIAQLQKAWKDKYGQDFDIKENKVYAPLAFAQGKINDVDAFMKQWPLDPTPLKANDGARTAGATIQTERVREQANIEKGREIAVVRAPAEFGLPALNLSMIDEAFGWKLDVPNNIQGKTLQANLLKHLTFMGEHMDQWPADVNDAYRYATHQVLMAVYGIDLPRDHAGADHKN